jgi:DNA-binding response OmpR family regulator
MRQDMEGSITMSDDQGMKPRLLLVEDDAISCSFMQASLEALPAHVDIADSLATALGLDAKYDLWLLDANLPDGSGIELLQALRARSPHVPALAHTADDSPVLHARLLAAGFTDVMVKPLSAAQLQDAARCVLGGPASTRFRVSEMSPTSPMLPLWDERTALAALNGNVEHVTTLRLLFLDELLLQQQRIVLALQRGDEAAARHELHQLKASSGFVGALRLNAAAARLEKALADADVFEAFTMTVVDTLSAR